MTVMMLRSMTTDRGTAAVPSPRLTRMPWSGLLEGGVAVVVRQRTAKGSRVVAARVSRGRWTLSRNINSAAVARPQRKSHVAEGHAPAPEARGGRGVGGVQGHVLDPIAPGEDLLAISIPRFCSQSAGQKMVVVKKSFYSILTPTHTQGLNPNIWNKTKGQRLALMLVPVAPWPPFWSVGLCYSQRLKLYVEKVNSMVNYFHLTGKERYFTGIFSFLIPHTPVACIKVTFEALKTHLKVRSSGITAGEHSSPVPFK